MSEQKQAKARLDLKPHELVERLMPDMTQPMQDVTLLTGLLGRDSKEGRWRLYTSIEMTDYFVIDEADVMASQPIEKEHSMLGGTMLFVRADAKIQHVSTTAIEAKAAFLSGGIAETGLPSTEVGNAALAGLQPARQKYTAGFWCTVSMFFACTTHVVTNSVCHLASGKVCLAAPGVNPLD